MARTKKSTNDRAAKTEGRARVAKKTAGAAAPASAAKIASALRRAEEALWDTGVPTHHLLQQLHEALLLRCLQEAGGNYAAAAEMFGPSRQSVQQYANSPLRDARWRPYQQNRRKKSEA